MPVDFEARADGKYEMADVLAVAVAYSPRERKVGLLLEWDEDDPIREQFAFSAERAGELAMKLFESAIKAGWSPVVSGSVPDTSSLD